MESRALTCQLYHLSCSNPKQNIRDVSVLNLNSFPSDKIVVCKLKEFADGHFEFDENGGKFS